LPPCSGSKNKPSKKPVGVGVTNTVNESTEALIDASIEVGLEVNTDNTKCI
jgi:hypothetical protein